MIAGGAAWKAAEMLSEKVKRVAAHLYNASVEAITIADGMIQIEGGSAGDAMDAAAYEKYCEERSH